MSATPPEHDGGDGSGPSRANLAALVAIIVLAALGYWAFTAIDHARKVQRCLDSGRRDCVDFVKPNK